MKGTSFLPAKHPAFTLIELLIVVAIIAILAAIAVPNFLEAQVRAKISRARADMRTMATGLESYRVDYNAYPKCNNFWLAGARAQPDERSSAPLNMERRVLERLSTPLTYLSKSIMTDPFPATRTTGPINSTTGDYVPQDFTPQDIANMDLLLKMKYATTGDLGPSDVENPTEQAKWAFVMVSCGPDQTTPDMSGLLAVNAQSAAVANNIYDATNGTISNGEIFRVGGTPPSTGLHGGPFFSATMSMN